MIVAVVGSGSFDKIYIEGKFKNLIPPVKSLVLRVGKEKPARGEKIELEPVPNLNTFYQIIPQGK